MKKENGAVLLYSVFLMVIFGVLAAALLPITTSSQLGTHLPNNSLQSRYLAESGVHYGVSALFHADPDDLEQKILPPLESRYTLSTTDHFEVDITGDFPDYIITATGISGSGSNETRTSLTYNYQISVDNPVLQFKRLFQIYSGGSNTGGADAIMQLEAACTMDSGIASASKIYIKNGAAVTGLYGGSIVEVENGATVEKEIIAMGDVIIRGIVKGDLHAHGDVYLYGSGKVEGNIYTTGNVYLKNWESKVGGNIEAGKNIETYRDPSDCCGGTLTAKGTINDKTVSNDSKIIPGKAPDTEVKEISIPEPPKTATYHPGTTNLSTAYKKKTIALTTNHDNANSMQQYGSVTVGYNGSLVLQSGTYHFNDLTVGSDAKLVFDIDETKNQKDIRIFVKGEASFQNGLKIRVRVNGVEKDINTVDKEYARLVYMETGGNMTLNSSSQWFGTAYSNSRMSFGDASKIVGAMVGKELATGRASTTLTHVASDYALSAWYE